jgi:threonine/homoserine/homoserine lactone efflux protein
MTPVFVALLAFVVAAGIVVITPGLDTALVLRTAAVGGARPAALAALGIAIGCLGWALLVAAGLGALLTASQTAYTALRWIGAGYLVWVGASMLRRPRGSFDIAAPRELGGARGAFATGALTNLLNPKVGVFYVSFLPHFVPDGVAVAPFILLLGAIHAALGLVWLAALIAATRPIVRWLRRPRVLRALDRATGGVFVAFGAALLWEGRR